MSELFKLIEFYELLEPPWPGILLTVLLGLIVWRFSKTFAHDEAEHKQRCEAEKAQRLARFDEWFERGTRAFKSGMPASENYGHWPIEREAWADGWVYASLEEKNIR